MKKTKKWKQLQGERSPHSRYKQKDIIAILERMFAGDHNRFIMEDYKISQCYLSRLARRENWRCIKHPPERLKRWREWLASPEWHGVKRSPIVIKKALEQFDASFN